MQTVDTTRINIYDSRLDLSYTKRFMPNDNTETRKPKHVLSRMFSLDKEINSIQADNQSFKTVNQEPYKGGRSFFHKKQDLSINHSISC